MVRLKENVLIVHHSIVIKFQFLMVRLKELQRLQRDKMIYKFQFLMVRLKEVLYRETFVLVV